MYENELEIYRQRYETWRHLDKVRYQILRLSVAFVGAIALIARITTVSFPSWFPMVVGVLMIILWQALSKVNGAIIANGSALKKHGIVIGDTDIPDVSSKYRSVFQYISILYGISGFSLVAWGIICAI